MKDERVWANDWKPQLSQINQHSLVSSSLRKQQRRWSLQQVRGMNKVAWWVHASLWTCFQSAPFLIWGSSLRINKGLIQKHRYSQINVAHPSGHDPAVCWRWQEAEEIMTKVHRCPRTRSPTSLISCKFDFVHYNEREENIRMSAGRWQQWSAAAPIQLHIAETPVPVGSTRSKGDEYHEFLQVHVTQR